jgi:hypothetical protein
VLDSDRVVQVEVCDGHSEAVVHDAAAAAAAAAVVVVVFDVVVAAAAEVAAGVLLPHDDAELLLEVPLLAPACAYHLRVRAKSLVRRCHALRGFRSSSLPDCLPVGSRLAEYTARSPYVPYAEARFAYST